MPIKQPKEQYDSSLENYEIGLRKGFKIITKSVSFPEKINKKYFFVFLIIEIKCGNFA